MDIFKVGTRFRYKARNNYIGVITSVERTSTLNFYKFEYIDTSSSKDIIHKLLYTHSDLVKNWDIINDVLLPDE